MGIVHYYERYWQADGGHTVGSIGPHLSELYERHLRPGRCLDLGCGDGRTSGVWLRQRGFDYVGVDVSETAVVRARSIGLEAHVIEDASTLPFADADFDCAVCIEVLEHLLDPLAAIQELRRVLQPGGILVVTVPNAVYWRRRADMLIGHWNPLGDALSAQQPWRAPHIRFFSARILQRLLASAGFEHVRTAGHGGGLLSDMPILRDWFTMNSGTYARTRDRLPSLLAYTISVVCYSSPAS